MGKTNLTEDQHLHPIDTHRVKFPTLKKRPHFLNFSDLHTMSQSSGGRKDGDRYIYP